MLICKSLLVYFVNIIKNIFIWFMKIKIVIDWIDDFSFFYVICVSYFMEGFFVWYIFNIVKVSCFD